MWPFLAFGGVYAGAATLGLRERPARVPWLALFVLTVLFVGLRHSVGMDWNNYLRMVYRVHTSRDFWSALQVSEPLYAILLICGDATGAGIYAVNLFSAVLVSMGLFSLARRTPEPWMALAAAMPMFVVVVAMSANRQAIAAGLLMMIIAHWRKLSIASRVILIIVAAGFHASALVFLVFVAIDLRISNYIKYIGIVIFSGVAVYLLQISGYGDYYNSAYGETQSQLTQSSGALFHVAMNAVPAALYVATPSRLRDRLLPNAVLKHMAIAALITVPLAFAFSAAAGRVSLYWFPISMWVWASLPSIVAERFRRLVRVSIAAAMFTILVGWLTFANSAVAHIPYENALFTAPWELQIDVLP